MKTEVLTLGSARVSRAAFGVAPNVSPSFRKRKGLRSTQLRRSMAGMLTFPSQVSDLSLFIAYYRETSHPAELPHSRVLRGGPKTTHSSKGRKSGGPSPACSASRRSLTKPSIIAGFYTLSIFEFRAVLCPRSTFSRRKYLISLFFTSTELFP